MRIVVVAHDPAWRAGFEEEASRILRVLGDRVLRLHHIGSTAIPGIAAKPVIDLLMEVEDIVELDERNSGLEELGYESMGEFGITGRRYFRKDNAFGVRTHQVHAFAAESTEIARHLAFRDYMIAHPAEARVYGELKRNLAREFPEDIQRYMDGKDPFIKEHQARALVWWTSRKAK
jgi:GrpB-like predicted nucleotidyltransferase (UPF0157 family)